MSLAITFRGASRAARILAACGAALLFGLASAQNSSPPASPASLYESAPDAVGRAKAFPKYGEALFVQIRRDVEAGQYPAALSKLEDYIARVKGMRQELKAAIPDPEKKANGFKQLQIHVRKTVRTLDHTIVVVPVPERPPFLAGRRDIEALDKELIADLFPRQPGRKEPDAKKDKP